MNLFEKHLVLKKDIKTNKQTLQQVEVDINHINTLYNELYDKVINLKKQINNDKIENRKIRADLNFHRDKEKYLNATYRKTYYIDVVKPKIENSKRNVILKQQVVINNNSSEKFVIEF